MLKEYFSLNEIEDNFFRIINLSLSVFILLFIGYMKNNFLISSLASLGLFTFFYYQNLPIKFLIKRLLCIGISLFIAFILSVVSSQILWIAPIVVAIVSFFSRFILRLRNISRPGALFFAIISAMGTSINIPLASVPRCSIYFLFGVFVAIISGVITKKLDKREEIILEKKTLKEQYENDPLLIVDAFFYSGALFLSVYISHGLNLQNPYWMTLACASILLAENLEAMKKRHIQYLIGSTLGLILSSILLSMHISNSHIIFVIPILYAVSQYFVARNYAIANIFLNPMALLLSSLLKKIYAVQLIEFRILGILLGSFIGLMFAWVMTKGLSHYILTLEKRYKE